MELIGILFKARGHLFEASGILFETRRFPVVSRRHFCHGILNRGSVESTGKIPQSSCELPDHVNMRFSSSTVQLARFFETLGKTDNTGNILHLI